MFSLLAVGFMVKALAVLFVITAILLILLVLVQKGKGGGLTGALGGMGGAGSLLGTKTGDFLTWFTIGIASLFLLLSIMMAKFYKPADFQAEAQQTPAAQTAPADTNE